MTTPLVTTARYKAITGDTTTGDPAISAAIEDATDRLEERLDRPLRSASRSEAMYPDQMGRAYPHAVPITVADGYTIDGYSLVGAWPWPWFDIVTDSRVAPQIVYTGGWVERTANPTAPNRLPTYFEEDIAWAAYALLHPSSDGGAAYPAGAVSVSLGDASVSFGPGGAPGPNRSGIRWSNQTLRWRYSRIAGA